MKWENFNAKGVMYNKGAIYNFFIAFFKKAP
jgi:hypothetical protein